MNDTSREKMSMANQPLLRNWPRNLPRRCTKYASLISTNWKSDWERSRPSWNAESCCHCGSYSSVASSRARWYCGVNDSTQALASPGLVLPGAATHGVTFFPKKNWRPFLIIVLYKRPLQSDYLLSCRVVLTPTFRHRLSSVLSKFSHNYFHSSVTPWLVSPWTVRPLTPLVTPLNAIHKILAFEWPPKFY